MGNSTQSAVELFNSVLDLGPASLDFTANAVAKIHRRCRPLLLIKKLPQMLLPIKLATLASLLALSGCSRPDTLVIWNGYTEEIRVTKVSVDGVYVAEFSETALNGVQGQWKGGAAFIDGHAITNTPVVEIEWLHKNATSKASCSYQRSRGRCEVDISINERGLFCGACDRPLGF